MALPDIFTIKPGLLTGEGFDSNTAIFWLKTLGVGVFGRDFRYNTAGFAANRSQCL